jgi:predicted DNA-binding transcriptional regulator AlpA
MTRSKQVHNADAVRSDPPRMEIAPRRGLCREEAARYVGVGTTKFDEMVRDHRMPQPVRIDGRLVWDLRRLDAAFDALSSKPEADPYVEVR